MPYTTMHDKAWTLRSPNADVWLDHPGWSHPGSPAAQGSERSSGAVSFARDEAATGSAPVARGTRQECEPDGASLRPQSFHGLRLAQATRQRWDARPRSAQPQTPQGATADLVQ